jgi:hypothetical protein
MRMPFERLMEYAASLDGTPGETTMGELAGRVGEDPFRLADAVTAVRVLRGERTYVSAADIRATMHPAVRKAVEADRGTIVAGGPGDVFRAGD